METETSIRMTNNKKSNLSIIVACLIFGISGATSARADDPDFLSLSLCAFETFDNKTAAEGRVEYRANSKLWLFKPFSGFMATSDKAIYGYLGVLIDFYFGRPSRALLKHLLTVKNSRTFVRT